MPSFNCDGCGDVIKKPKLDSHSYRCQASFTCLDCSITFTNSSTWKLHTACITEAEKFEKSVYKGPKGPREPKANNKSKQGFNQNTDNQIKKTTNEDVKKSNSYPNNSRASDKNVNANTNPIITQDIKSLKPQETRVESKNENEVKVASKSKSKPEEIIKKPKGKPKSTSDSKSTSGSKSAPDSKPAPESQSKPDPPTKESISSETSNPQEKKSKSKEKKRKYISLESIQLETSNPNPSSKKSKSKSKPDSSSTS